MKILPLISAFIILGCGQAACQTQDLNSKTSPSGTFSEDYGNNHPFALMGGKRPEIKEEGFFAFGEFQLITDVPETETYGVIGALFLCGLVYFRRKRMC